ncbi:unnamed protein product, partial [Gongylonema pulchrum]|uniref:Sin3a_C domain-containing protein n=1 Tax=Gongylonema pulchrum TaxID=637853 RepID=A0A183D320_9BILA
MRNHHSSPFFSKDEPPEKDLNRSCSYRLFYGTNAWCVFIELHHLLCSRLATFKKKHQELIANHEVEERLHLKRQEIIERAYAERGTDLTKSTGRNFSQHLNPDISSPKNYYTCLIKALKQRLDGTVDNDAFEEIVRALFGASAYLSFTMDAIIMVIIRQLQHL